MSIDGKQAIVEEGEKSLVGVDASTGKLLWQAPFAGRGMMAYNAATPIVDGSTIICTGHGHHRFQDREGWRRLGRQRTVE